MEKETSAHLDSNAIKCDDFVPPCNPPITIWLLSQVCLPAQNESTMLKWISGVQDTSFSQVKLCCGFISSVLCSDCMELLWGEEAICGRSTRVNHGKPWSVTNGLPSWGTQPTGTLLETFQTQNTMTPSQHFPSPRKEIYERLVKCSLESR